MPIILGRYLGRLLIAYARILRLMVYLVMIKEVKK